MEETIELKEALAQMYRTDARGASVPFSVAFVTADRRMKTGGEIIKLPEAIVFSKDKLPQQPKTAQVSKSPNHRARGTINFFLPGPQRYMKAHVDLLLLFNRKWIIW